MNSPCSRAPACETLAFIEEAQLLAAAPDDRLKENGISITAANVVINAAFATIAQLGERYTQLQEERPSLVQQCGDCLLQRNKILQLALEDLDIPDGPADL